MKSPKCSEYSTIRIVESNASSRDRPNDTYVYLVDIFDYLVTIFTHDHRSTDTAVWYPIYAGGLLFLITATIFMWVASYNEPILFSLELGLWLQGNPKLSALVWTTISSLLSALTLYLLNGVFLIMQKQLLAARGVTLSRIEGT